EYEFAVRAGKQLLVAMREATSGRDFDAIIASEYESIGGRDLRIVYVAVCIATAGGYTVSAQQIVALTDGEPNLVLAALKGDFQDIIVPAGEGRGAYHARHRIIASLIVDGIAPREIVKEAYIRLLQVLSRDLPRNPRRSDRVFRLYKNVINHATVWDRFQRKLEMARDVFESIREYFRSDHHYWLQYGSLELEYGELDLAETYIDAAASIDPDDEIVQTTRALLFYKRSEVTDRISEASAFREAAREILIEQIKHRVDAVYPYHIMCSGELQYIRTWLSGYEVRKRPLEELKRDIDSAVKKHPYSDRLADLKKQIDGAYLELALDQ
ncbi:MAG TPA: hypothetical protein VFE31_08500, partial [Opitutaceae bacterium]|nr:hypothetical protein [Opitutaceae bacterium]